MFDTKKTFSNRIANAFDLAIDFATLGEYGLEPVGRTAPSCESRRHPRSLSAGERRRPVDRGFAVRS
jgi:hypothetical protein